MILLSFSVLASGILEANRGAVDGFLGTLSEEIVSEDDGTKYTTFTPDEKYLNEDGTGNSRALIGAAIDLGRRQETEGAVLLKNEGSALPLTGSEKISVFGKNSVNLAYGSSGSVGGSTDKATTLFDSLTASGFAYNETLKGFYEDNSLSGDPRPSTPAMSDNALPDGFATGETDPDTYPDNVLKSIDDFSDVALVVITRTSGENSDLPTTMKNTKGAMSEDDHYLELDENEQEMLKLACEKCDKVVLLVNSGTPIELGFLDAADDGDATTIGYDFASGVDAAFQIGLPGETGMSAIGKLLKGDINPSGKTTDTYARDFMKIPAVENFSLQGVANLDSYTLNGKAQDQWFIDYEEGIYIGYRYYETRGAENDAWYDANVVYPMGYGLSYTTFSQEIADDNTNIEPTSAWTAETRDLTVAVNVTNTGERAGKEVVQIYAELPYEEGGIEKAHKVLVGFGKTGLLEPGASEQVVVTFNPYDFASYDYDDANGNGKKAYELEAGSYTFVVGKNAHEAFDSVTTNLTSDVIFETDPVTGYSVENRFDNIDDQLGSVLSRSDWEGTYPAMRSADEKAVSSEFMNELNSTDSGNPLTADSEVVKEAAANRVPATVKNPDGMQLYEQLKFTEDGVYNGTLPADDDSWNALVARLTVSSLWDVLSDCAFKTPSLSYIGKPQTLESDGPAGWTKFMGDATQIYDTCFFACEPILAATWNIDLAEAMGRAIGNEGLIGREEKGSERTVLLSADATPSITAKIPCCPASWLLRWYAARLRKACTATSSTMPSTIRKRTAAAYAHG